MLLSYAHSAYHRDQCILGAQLVLVELNRISGKAVSVTRLIRNLVQAEIRHFRSIYLLPPAKMTSFGTAFWSFLISDLDAAPLFIDLYKFHCLGEKPKSSLFICKIWNTWVFPLLRPNRPVLAISWCFSLHKHHSKMTLPCLPVKPKLLNLALKAWHLPWPHLTYSNLFPTVSCAPDRWVLPLGSNWAESQFLSFPFATLRSPILKCDTLWLLNTHWVLLQCSLVYCSES